MLDWKEKIKFIVIGLAGILAVSILINLQSHIAKKAIERERNSLKSENVILSQKIEEYLKERKQLQERVGALNNDLEKISQEKETLSKEKEEAQAKFEAIVKERDALAEKLKTVAAGPVSTKEEAYWAGILQSKTNLSLQIDNLRQELNTLQIDNEQLRQELEGLTREKEDLEQQLNYSQRTSDNISSQLVIEKSAKLQMQNELKPVKNENAILRRQLKSLSIRKIKLENQLRQLQEEKSGLERRLNEIGLFLEDRFSREKDLELKSQLDAAREAVELAPIIVRPQTAPGGVTPGQTERPLTQERGTQVYAGGSVLEVNKEHNFAVIDLGQNTGIKMGDTFRVYRGGKVIATIEVIQVGESVSACDIKKQTAPVEAGDTVR